MMEQRRITLILSGAVAVLTLAVAGLAFTTLQASAKIEQLTADAKEAAEEVQHFALAEKDPDAETQPLQPIPWDPFGTGFDPQTWDPFQELEKMRAQMDAMFNGSFGRFGMSPRFSGLVDNFAFSPKADLVDEGNQYVVRLDLPGADDTHTEVELEGQTLLVKATTEEESNSGGQGTPLLKERRVGSFQKQVQLPAPVDSSGMKTEYADGVLTITIPKQQ